MKIYEILEDGSKFYLGIADTCFKAIFGNNKNIDLLESLLIDVRRSKNIPILGKIKKVYIPELPKKEIINKKKSLDLLAETNTGEIILIEMNTSTYDGLKERNFSYAADIYSRSLDESENYKDVKCVVQVNFTSGLKSKEVKKEYALTNIEKTNDLFIDTFYIIEYNLDVIRKSTLKEYKYIKMLMMDNEELEKGDTIMSKYGEVLKEVNGNGEVRLLLSAEEDARKTMNTIIRNAKEEGMEKGKEKGFEEGSKNKEIEIAKNMLKDNQSIDNIIKYTGLSLEEINSLMN